VLLVAVSPKASPAFGSFHEPRLSNSSIRGQAPNAGLGGLYIQHVLNSTASASMKAMIPRDLASKVHIIIINVTPLDPWVYLLSPLTLDFAP
jgi:hypothetical protein